MKKLLITIGVALVAAITLNAAPTTTYTLEVPTNVPPALIQNMIAGQTMQLAASQIYAATPAQLATLSPALTAQLADLNTRTATMNGLMTTNEIQALINRQVRASAMTYLRTQTNVSMINSNIVAKLPVPVRR